MSGFLGLNIAMSALRAQQQAMSVTANNIANANTEGYHRQEARFTPGNPVSGAFAMVGVGNPQLGTGVSVRTINRIQSSYIDQQVRSTKDQLGAWGYKQDQLAQIESIFSEPGELGLSDTLNKFWNAWSELATSPESGPAKISVVQRAVALSQRINTLYTGLREMQTQTDQDIVDNVSQVNALAQDIANINVQIRRSVASGYQPNELMDMRDNLLDEISAITNIQISGAEGAEMIISISGKPLVQGQIVNQLTVTRDGEGWAQPTWSNDGSAALVTGGQLAGQLEMRDQVVQSYIDKLNELAASITDEVNAIHSAGIVAGAPAGDFFVAGSDASNLSVTPALISNSSGVAADVANSVAALRSRTLAATGQSINDSYLRLVSTIGAQSREAISRMDTYNATVEQLQTQREGISGVSIDEEMLNLTKFQQAYNAAARMATTIDEMVDTVINRLGVVGR